MTSALLVSVIAASFVGSIHCAGMCGGFVALAGGGTTRSERLFNQIAYNFGRLLSYAGLGAAAGAIGHAVDLAGSAAGLGRIAAVVSGVWMLLWGLGAMLAAQGLAVKLRQRFAAKGWNVAPWFARLQAAPPRQRAFWFGLATTLLPCGWLYAFTLSAAATANPLRGALVMAAFWLGNVPTLLGLGVVLGDALSKIRRHVPMLSASAIFVVGLVTLFTRTSLPAFAAIGAAAEPSTIGVPKTADCPCHRRSH